MAWLTENSEHVLAILGGLYLVARTVVHLTPTPKDDAALAKVSGVLKALAAAFGLDLKQGRGE